MLTKRAYAHGMMKSLIDTEIVKAANEELAAAIANQAGDAMPVDPAELGEGETMPAEADAELATNLVQLSNSLQDSANNAAAAADSAAANATKAASLFVDNLRKMSAEGTGGTVIGDGTDPENTIATAPTAEGKLDQANRPGGSGYANVGEDGVGSQAHSGVGAIGAEVQVAKGESGPAQHTSNSATEATETKNVKNNNDSKLASAVEQLTALLKEAKGGTVDGSGGPVKNTMSEVASNTGEGTMEANRRPSGYANKGEDNPGESSQTPEEQVAAIGEEKAHPDRDIHSGSSNTAVQQSKVAEEDQEYLNQLRKIGQAIVPHLPFYLNDAEKVAAAQYAMSLAPSERAGLRDHLVKTAGDMPEGLKKYLASKGEGKKEDGKKEDGKKEDGKKEDGKKEDDEKEEEKKSSSDILSAIRQMNA